jgi:amino-acid N-acetyltransferase
VNITIREARDSDEGTIRSILESQNLPTESVGTGKTEFFLALENTVPVGVAGFEYYGEDALLRSVAVPSDLQNKKIGSKLVDWMIDLAKQKSRKRIILLTESAERFFARRGFVTVARSSVNNAAMQQSSQFDGSSCCSKAACMMLELR